jgi:hypothetical protein
LNDLHLLVSIKVVIVGNAGLGRVKLFVR